MGSFQIEDYDIMEVPAKQFDDDFYDFRCRIKEMERYFVSGPIQGFDNCDAIYVKLINIGGNMF